MAQAAGRGRRLLLVAALVAAAGGAPAEEPWPPAPPGPYALSLAVDGPILGASAALLGAAVVLERTQTGAVATGDPDHLLRIDRVALGRDEPAHDSASTVLQDALVVLAPLGVGLAAWDGGAASLAPAAVVGESILASASVCQLTKSVVRRPRPYTYAEGSASGEGARSFYSGHTTASFAAATSATVVLHRLDPEGVAPWVAAGVGFSAATAVGVLRVTSGKHFPTDVAVGALTGAAIGWGVPALHERPRGLTVAFGPRDVAVSGRF